MLRRATSGALLALILGALLSVLIRSAEASAELALVESAGDEPQGLKQQSVAAREQEDGKAEAPRSKRSPAEPAESAGLDLSQLDRLLERDLEERQLLKKFALDWPSLAALESEARQTSFEQSPRRWQRNENLAGYAHQKLVRAGGAPVYMRLPPRFGRR